MIGYILALSNDGTSGTIQQEGTFAPNFTFVDYTGIPLKVQVRVSFSVDALTGLAAEIAAEIGPDGMIYDVPSNQIAWYQTQLSA
jgi:hypothetical protein